MAGFGNPGYRLGKGNRLLSLLLRQNLNNGSRAGGIAHAVNSGLTGYIAGQDARREKQAGIEEMDAIKAMARGGAAQPWQNPDSQVHAGPPGTPGHDLMLSNQEAAARAAPTGGLDGQIAALSNMDTFAAGKLGASLQRQKSELDARTSERNAERRRKAQVRQNELVETTDAKTGGRVWMRRGEIQSGMPSRSPKPPASRTVQMGGQNVTQEWDAATGQYVEVGRGNRHAPQRETPMWAFDKQTGGDVRVTESQVRANPNRYAKAAPRASAPGTVITLTSPDGRDRISRHTNDPDVQARLAAGWLREDGGDVIDRFIAAAMQGQNGTAPPAPGSDPTVPAAAPPQAAVPAPGAGQNIKMVDSPDALPALRASGQIQVGDVIQEPGGRKFRVLENGLEEIVGGHAGGQVP